MNLTNRAAVTATFLLAALSGLPTSQAGLIIAPGSNLLQFDPGLTEFYGHPFQGVPLGTYDFGGSVGLQNVGPTDTIIRRVQEASVAGPGQSDTILTVIDAFQLRSVSQVSVLGGPLGFYYITLASLRGAPVSFGTMTMNFGPEGDPHGTFSSSFSLHVDVRLGSLDGPILESRQILIPDSGQNPWRHDPTGPVQIPGVNVDLNGVDSEQDFWIVGSVSKDTPNGRIVARSAGAPIPEPALASIFFGLAAVGWAVARRRT